MFAGRPMARRLRSSSPEPMRGADQNRDIWLYDETHDELRRLTTSDEPDRSPRWSPDV